MRCNASSTSECFSKATQSSASLHVPSMHLCGVLSPRWRFSHRRDKYHTHTYKHRELAAEQDSSQSHVQVSVRSAVFSLRPSVSLHQSVRTWGDAAAWCTAGLTCSRALYGPPLISYYSVDIISYKDLFCTWLFLCVCPRRTFSVTWDILRHQTQL